MPNYYTPQTIQAMLDKFAESRKEKDYMKAPEYESLYPKALNYQPVNSDLYEQIREKVLKNSEAQTAIAMVRAQNRYNYKQYQDQTRANQLAHKNFTPYNPNSGGGGGTLTGGYPKQTWGKDGIPEISDIKNLNPEAPLRTMTFHGMNYTVNSQVAPVFQAFLTSLWRMGYKPKSIGGYSDRNIAGTNVKSLHSYGLAIDIDPSRNPVTWNGQNITALPPGVGALAAKYGLMWGGSWKGSKRDTMHFSVPYGGRY